MLLTTKKTAFFCVSCIQFRLFSKTMGSTSNHCKHIIYTSLPVLVAEENLSQTWRWSQFSGKEWSRMDLPEMCWAMLHKSQESASTIYKHIWSAAETFVCHFTVRLEFAFVNHSSWKIKSGYSTWIWCHQGRKLSGVNTNYSGFVTFTVFSHYYTYTKWVFSFVFSW